MKLDRDFHSAPPLLKGVILYFLHEILLSCRSLCIKWSSECSNFGIILTSRVSINCEAPRVGSFGSSIRKKIRERHHFSVFDSEICTF